MQVDRAPVQPLRVPMVCHPQRMGRRRRIIQIVLTAILGVIALVWAMATDTWALYFTALAMVVAGASQLERLPPRQ